MDLHDGVSELSSRVVTIGKRSDNLRGFVVLPRRGVVERSFSWLNRHRRLVRDYERLPEHHEAMLLRATTVIMTRQLVRQLTDQPPEPRWGNERISRSPSRKIQKQHETPFTNRS